MGKRGKHQCVAACRVPQAGYLARNPGMCPEILTSHPQVCMLALSPRSHTSQGHLCVICFLESHLVLSCFLYSSLPIDGVSLTLTLIFYVIQKCTDFDHSILLITNSLGRKKKVHKLKELSLASGWAYFE